MRLSGRHHFNSNEYTEKLRDLRDEAFAFAKFEDGDPLPDGKGGYRTFDTVPDGVYWYRYIKEFGFPNRGGWLNQPYLFMMEINSVRAGLESAGNSIEDKLYSVLSRLEAKLQ